MESDRKALTRRLRGEEPSALPYLALIGDWKKETTSYLSSLTANQKEDVISLLMADAEMLIAAVDPPHSEYKPSEDDRLDFRQRYYEALPLLVIVEELGFPKASAARSYFNDVESFAAKKDWLP
jgi:hypothetical protein